jgi:superfamily II DNA or RNA helicase
MTDFIAYIDVASGSLIIQAVVATVIAVPFFFRQQLGRVVRAVRGQGRSDAEPAADVAADRSGNNAR